MTEDNMRKGKLAERIVEQMFKEAGFKVIRSGYESTFSTLADRYNLIQGDAAEYIRHHPDFIVVNPRNEAFLIEVKFRRYGVIDQKAMFNYPATQVILLTKDSMHCQSLQEIHKNGRRFVGLEAIKPFCDIPLATRQKYIRKARRLLGDENLLGQFIEDWSQRIVGKSFKQPYTPGEIKFTYIEDFNKEGASYEVAGNTEIISSDTQEIKTTTDGRRWTDDQIERLRQYHATGMSINDIAANLGKEREAVLFRLAKLGLMSFRDAFQQTRGDSRRSFRGNGGRNVRRSPHRGSHRPNHKQSHHGRPRRRRH